MDFKKVSSDSSVKEFALSRVIKYSILSSGIMKLLSPKYCENDERSV